MQNDFTVVFDLDGTLIDSQASILASIKIALDQCDISSRVPLTEDLIGPPLLETLSVICGTSNPAALSLVAAMFKDAYDSVGYKNSIRYEGVDKLLEWLVSEGYEVCLVTNKRRTPTERILDHFKWRSFFSHVYMIDSGEIPFKNKTEAIAALLQEAGINPKRAVYVGDRHEDYEAAANNNMKCLLVTWGYGISNSLVNRGVEVNTSADLMQEIRKLG